MRGIVASIVCLAFLCAASADSGNDFMSGFQQPLSQAPVQRYSTQYPYLPLKADSPVPENDRLTPLMDEAPEDVPVDDLWTTPDGQPTQIGLEQASQTIKNMMAAGKPEDECRKLVDNGRDEICNKEQGKPCKPGSTVGRCQEELNAKAVARLTSGQKCIDIYNARELVARVKYRNAKVAWHEATKIRIAAENAEVKHTYTVSELRRSMTCSPEAVLSGDAYHKGLARYKEAQDSEDKAHGEFQSAELHLSSEIREGTLVKQACMCQAKNDIVLKMTNCEK
jgi:hypothetical protein